MIEFSYICYSSYLPVSDFVIKSAVDYMVYYTPVEQFFLLYTGMCIIWSDTNFHVNDVFTLLHFSQSLNYFSQKSHLVSRISTSRLYLFKQLGR